MRAHRRRLAPSAEPLEPRRPLANAREAVLAAALDAGRDAIPGEYIVQLRARSARPRALAAAIPLTADGRTLLAQLDTRALARLRALRAVRSLTPNAVLAPAATSDDPYSTDGSLWGTYGDDPAVSPLVKPNRFGSQAEESWARGLTGSRSVVVGVLDKGVMTTHPDLAANIWTNPFDPPDGIDNDRNGYVDDVHGWDFSANDNSVYDGPADDHGTLVAGALGAVGGNGVGIAGVAWQVTILPVKILGPRGGTLDMAIRGLDYLTDLKTRHGLNVVAVNASWTGGLYCQPLADAIARAARADILFVAAAGNGPSNVGASNDLKPTYPASYSTRAAAGYESVVSVAALTTAGKLAAYSNFGATSVDLAAPGSGIVSTLPAKDGTPTYASRNGTSMAAPFVSGAIALYAAAHPTATARQIRDALLASAAPTPALNGLVATGGRLDVSAMLAMAPGSVVSVSRAATAAAPRNAASPLLDAPPPTAPRLRAPRPRTRALALAPR
jgi:subtilisin family serine protease